MMNEINDEKLNIGIKKIRNIKMTSQDKENILNNILNSPIQKTEITKPIKSPWVNFSFLSNRLSYLAIAICLVLLIGTGTFYNIQINNERDQSIAKINTQNLLNFQNTPSISNNLQNDNVVENDNSNNPSLAIINKTDISNENKTDVVYQAPTSSSIQTSPTGTLSFGSLATNPDKSITIIYPNGGETFNKGEKITTKWQTKNIDPSARVNFNLITINGQSLENKNLIANWSNISNTGEATLTIPNDISSGEYKLSATISAEIKDISDDYFTLKK
jgi:hypothetical protein